MSRTSIIKDLSTRRKILRQFHLGKTQIEIAKIVNVDISQLNKYLDEYRKTLIID